LIARFHANALRLQIAQIDSKMIQRQEGDRELQSCQLQADVDLDALRGSTSDLN
jgi:hypothetical protein